MVQPSDSDRGADTTTTTAHDITVQAERFAVNVAGTALRHQAEGWLVDLLDGRLVIGPFSTLRSANLLEREAAALRIGRRIEVAVQDAGA